jgi:LAS superfamily LD-carboxypeptidase LdcB
LITPVYALILGIFLSLSAPGHEVLADVIKSENREVFISADMDYIMGKFDPAAHKDFVLIPRQYRDNAVRYLRKDVMKEYAKMAAAAQRDGVKLVILSATRNYEAQKTIWNNKWKGKTILDDGTKASDIVDPVKRARKILLYSSMPGTSRHHWGTDVDLNALNNAWFEKGEGKKLYNWMQKNASSYGFCQVYGAKGNQRRAGYEEEKWHWSYLPQARLYSEEVEKKFKNEMISGFEGAHTATVIDMRTNYMMAIDPACTLP